MGDTMGQFLLSNIKYSGTRYYLPTFHQQEKLLFLDRESPSLIDRTYLNYQRNFWFLNNFSFNLIVSN